VSAGHFVSREPFDPHSIEALTPAQEKYYLASQWKLMWWKLKRHRLAVICGVILALNYATIMFSEVIAPYNLHTRNTDFVYSPPQSIHLFHDGEFVGPFVYGRGYELDMDLLKRNYPENRDEVMPLRFFCQGVCPPENGTFFLLGTDRLGRDMFSRITYGARISLTIGLVGILISFSFGIVIGGLAGYYGGWVDASVQRMIEVIRSFPELPLWMALSAILPVNWSPILIFFGITVILAMLDWTGLARAVRSKLLSLREEDYCAAAELVGAKPGRIIGRHLLPGFMSHLIASATLSVPAMILGETALSFLGLGLRPPVTSWGVLLNEAQNINVVALYPWLLFPVVPVILVIMTFNFFGDGLRDAADPYK
jgi:peptide/nickel transport system permease protein